MGRCNVVLAVIAMALVAVLTLSAWAFDCFPVIGLGKLSANPQIISSGVLPRLTLASQDFNNKLATILTSAGGQQANWVNKITNAMNKGAEIYSTKAVDMFSMKKDWTTAAQQFLTSWNYGGLTLNADTKNKIDSLTKSHFQKLSQILSSINRGKVK